jgi:hypothetical protein
MKKCLIIAAGLLFLSLPGFASSNPAPRKSASKTSTAHAELSRFRQFHIKSSRTQHLPVSQTEHAHNATMSASIEARKQALLAGLNAASSPATRSRRMNSSSTTVNFVAAARTPLGGVDDGRTTEVMGDFNGDGKMDVAKIVSNTVSSVQTYQIAVLLGNGDGTFQSAVLTNTDGNTDDPIVVGDLTGSGTDDIIQVHPSGGDCDYARRRAQIAHPQGLPDCGSSIDVMLSNGSGGFAAPVNYPISGNGLTGGTLVALNNDGPLNILLFDSASPANVIGLQGNGDGTFQSPVTLGTLTGVAPQNMIFADFNGDGNIDFAGQAENGQIQVTLATGFGLFANAPVGLNTTDGVYGACNSIAGNLTSASAPEIVSFNCEQNTVTVYMNNGDGSFATGLYYDNNGDQWQMINDGAIADMNGDGKADIVAINENSSDITVFLGNGDGTFAVTPMRYDVGGYAWNVPLVADFNGDGLMDVVESDDAYNLVYLQGYGEGTFKAAPTYSLPNTFNDRAYTYSVATGDFNGDGIPDVVVGQDGNNGSTGISVYLGKGDGTFLPGASFGPSTDMGELAVADFNGDGKLDVAAIDWQNQVIQIFLGNGDGTFSVAGEFAADTNNEPGANDLVVGDFNKDGKPDLAVSNYDGHVGVLLGNGDGTFAPVISYPVADGYSPQAIIAADVNGDGNLDLEVPAYGGDQQPAVFVFLGNSSGNGTFGEPNTVLINGWPNYIAVGDLNNDGKLDLAVSEVQGLTYNGQIEVLLGNGNGTFAAPVSYAASTFGTVADYVDPGNIFMADLTGSGNLGLVYLNSDWGTIAVATGNGDGTINAPIEFATTEDPWGMALVDTTGDGFLDVLTGDDDAGGFSVLINANGTGANPNYSIGAQTPGATVTAGASATYTLTLSGTYGYNGTVTFSCSNLPVGATCSFSPASVVANGAIPLTTTLTVTTTASATANLLNSARPGSKPASPVLLASLSGMGLFGLMLAGSSKKRSARILSGMMMLLMLCTVVACGGASSGKSASGTPAGTYVVTVTGTGTGTGAPTHNLNLSLTVQ